MRRSLLALAVLAVLTVLTGAAQAEELSAKEFKRLEKKLKQSLVLGDVFAVAHALEELAIDDSPRALSTILKQLSKVRENPRIYHAGVQAIARMTSAGVHNAIRKQLARPKADPKTFLLLDSLGARGDKDSDDMLAEVLASDHPALVRAALVGLGTSRASGPALVDLLGRCEGRTERTQIAALVQAKLSALSGQAFPSAEAWSGYWAEAKDDGPQKDAKRVEPAWPVRRGEIFGQPLFSERVLILFDVSESMSTADPKPVAKPKPGEPFVDSGSRVRIERAKSAVRQLVDGLPPTARFSVFAFSGAGIAGPGGVVAPPGLQPGWPLPVTVSGVTWLTHYKPNLMPANAKNKLGARDFVKALRTSTGGTFTLSALRHALAVRGVETIVLISDGVPNEPDYTTGKSLDPDDVLEGFRCFNSTRRVIVHTFAFPDGVSPKPAPGRKRRSGFGSGARFKRFMRELAEQSGGRFTQLD